MGVQKFDVIVIGGGIIGSAVGYYSNKKFDQVVIIEQFPAGNSRGSSHGFGRIIRKAHIAQAGYAQWMDETYEMWSALQNESRREIFRLCGLLVTQKRPALELKELEQEMNRLGHVSEVLSDAKLKSRFPAVRSGGKRVLLDPNGGWLFAQNALNAFQDLFHQNGGTILREKVLKIIQSSTFVEVRTDRQVLYGKKLVICAGAWSKELCSQIGLQLPLKTCPVNVYFWRVKDIKDAELYSMDKTPTFINIPERKSGISFGEPKGSIYGLPSFEYPGYIKVCWHNGKEASGADRRDESVWVGDKAWLSDYVRQHFPGVETRPSIHERCIYTVTPDRLCILDHHPANTNVVVATGFSGSGFKHAPMVGHVVTKMLSGEEVKYDLSSFRLTRFPKTVTMKSSL